MKILIKIHFNICKGYQKCHNWGGEGGIFEHDCHHSIRFMIHLGPNWNNFVVQNPSMLRQINTISLEPKILCVLNGIPSYHNNDWYYVNLGSIRRKLVQVAQRNCPKYLLESFKCHPFIWSHQIVCEFSSVIKFIDNYISRMTWT